MSEWWDVDTDSTEVNQKSRYTQQVCLEPSKELKAVGIAIGTKDFNSKNQDSEVSKNGDINYLSYIKEDLIIVTIMPSKNGWLEGYRARDKACNTGLCHIDFLKIIL